MRDMNPREWLRQRVRALGTQRAVARELGVSDVHVSDMLRGRRPVSDAMLAKMGLRRVVVLKETR